MNINEKIKNRRKFIETTTFGGIASAAAQLLPLSLLGNKEEKSNKKIIVKTNPLSVQRLKKGDTNE